MTQLAEALLAGVEPNFDDRADPPGGTVIGQSEEGRPIHAYTIGTGARRVSLVAGAHADEPVGPETLRLVAARADLVAQLCPDCTFLVVPHVNPDGAARNREWRDRWPDAGAYRGGAVREPPGRDVEFGYPDLRPENRAVSDYLRAHGPFDLHMSLHGMAIAEGGMLLIERHWVDRTQALREAYRTRLEATGLGLHDQDRMGDKGFDYLGPGFWTTPEGGAMRAYFRERGDEAMAARFRDSSMEFVRSLGGDPLCLVTEIPLFLVPNPAPTPGVPGAYLRLRERWSEPDVMQKFGVTPVSLRLAMSLQLDALALGLGCVPKKDVSR